MRLLTLVFSRVAGAKLRGTRRGCRFNFEVSHPSIWLGPRYPSQVGELFGVCGECHRVSGRLLRRDRSLVGDVAVGSVCEGGGRSPMIALWKLIIRVRSVSDTVDRFRDDFTNLDTTSISWNLVHLV